MIIISDHYFFDKSTFFNIMLIFRMNVWLKRLTQLFILKFFCYNKLRFNAAILSLNLKKFFEIFRVVVNANLNTFIIFVFVLIKEILEKDENSFINFAREIIDIWTFDLIVQLSADIINVVIFIRKKSYDVDMNKIHLSTIRTDMIIVILRLFDIANAWYTCVL